MAEFFSHPIPAVIILLGVLVFVHELGHFLVGRACGIAVEVFSIGFGPKITSFERGGTEFRISWIPLGGYVKFAGAHPSEKVPEHLDGTAFRSVSTGRRAATICAGPLANFLLAVVVYMALGWSGIPHPPAVIGQVIDGTPAAEAGFRYGDRVVSVDGESVETWEQLEKHIRRSPDEALRVTVERADAAKTLTLTPAVHETQDMAGREIKIGRAGIALGRVPSVITVMGAESPAAQAGLETGERITRVQAAGDSQDIRYYPEFLQFLDKAARGGAESVTLTVKPASLPGEKDPPNATPRQVTLSLPDELSGGEALARELGFYDSQLTVASAKETLKGVLNRGDRFVSLAGKPVNNIFELQEILMDGDRKHVEATVVRDHQEKSLTLTLKGVSAQRPEGRVTLYTLPAVFWGQADRPDPVIEQYGNPFSALWFGVKETGMKTGSLVVNVAALFTGEVPLKALGGPMMIAKVAGESAARGWQTFLNSMALISINLGLINLFPIPVLDGGQLVLVGAEAVRRRPLQEKAIENFQKVGFVMVLALVVLATYNDLSRFWKAMLKGITSVFQ